MDPDQTAPTGAIWSESTLFVYEASNILGDDKKYILWFYALRVNKCEFSVYTVRISMKCRHVWAAQTTYLFFTKLQIEPDFPCLANEIAEPLPDMNIKVAVFTVSQKSSNMLHIIPNQF